MKLIIPENYDPRMSVRDTQEAIKYIRDTFQKEFAKEMNIWRISAPLFLEKSTGLNDDLNGVERKVSFDLKEAPGTEIEIVQSLAKWKRMALKKYGFGPGEGLYTNMNAIRRDEELDNIHSVYVDQWDWEKVILPENRNTDYLKLTVMDIVSAICDTQDTIEAIYPQLQVLGKLKRDVSFVTTQELEDLYPDLTPKQRENAWVKEHRTAFIMGIGGALRSGQRHDGRAPDYDDWTTPNSDGFLGLNGDILIWYPILERSFELSSMGIRVDKEALLRQLELENKEERKSLYFHQRLLNDSLPATIGGGIGQSRLCMVLLQKGHIGEIQASIWPDEQREECRKAGMILI